MCSHPSLDYGLNEANMWLEVLARVDWAGLNFVEPAADSAKLGGHDIPTGDGNVHAAAQV